MTEESKKILIDLDLAKRILSQNPRTKLEAERELKLSQNICRSSKVLFRRSKFAENGQVIYLQRGQYFTTYRLLSDLWGCSLKAARYQVQKWCKSSLIKTATIKDCKSFDLGLIINYNPVFLEQNWGIRQKPKNKRSRNSNTQQGASLSVKNFHRKTTKEVVFLKDLNFGKRVVGKLVLLGFDYQEIEKLYLNYNLEEILDYHRLLKLSKRVTNPKAFLKAALKSKYSLKSVYDYRKSQRAEALEIRKNRYEEKERRRIEEEKLLSEKLKIQAEKTRQINIEMWLQEYDNRKKYVNKALEIAEQVKLHKDVKPTIETMTKRLLTRSNYKHFKDLYDKKVDQITGELLKELEKKYSKLYVELMRVGELTPEKITQLLQQKHEELRAIKTLDLNMERKIKMEVVREIPGLNSRLEAWVDEQIQQYATRQNTTHDQALATTSQANSWGIVESDPEGACTPRIGLFASINTFDN